MISMCQTKLLALNLEARLRYSSKHCTKSHVILDQKSKSERLTMSLWDITTAPLPSQGAKAA